MTTAQRMNNEEKLFMRWVVSYQTTIQFEEFKRKLNVDNNNFEDDRTEEEILESVKKILEGIHGTKHI